VKEVFYKRAGILLALVAVFGLTALGCGKAEPEKPRAEKPSGGDKAVGEEHDHSGWWCAEHGIPEAKCSMCSAEVAAKKKKEGDWCEKHDRALSQCFICNPERKEYYANVYRAQFGKEPPPIEE
jgi:hypothetical protein